MKKMDWRKGLYTVLFTSVVQVSAANIPESFTESEQKPLVFESKPSQDNTKGITPFTGKVSKSKVRLRLQPNLDSPVVKELNPGDLLVIDGVSDDFYAVRPPNGLKVYVMRTFVLDNVVEGSRVNIRLQPSTDAPSVGQLNTGDKVLGIPSTLNNKWLEIDPPSSLRFYVATEFVEKVGDANYLQIQEKRKAEVNQLLTQAQTQAPIELKKNYSDMKLAPIMANLNQIIDRYKDFPEYVQKAKDLKAQIEQQELQKKVSFLEGKVQQQNKAIVDNQSPQIQQAQKMAPLNAAPQMVKKAPTEKMLSWQSSEKPIIDAWLRNNLGRSQEDFYHEEREHATLIKGMIEPYLRPVRNKPGDYLLTTQDGRPLAYLYSTRVNLQDRVGQTVALWVTPRPNNDFAFPAYFVIDEQ